MKIIKRRDLPTHQLPGRAIQKAVGRDSASLSSQMTVGFAHYSQASGAMEPHRHAEETVIILDSQKGCVQFGESSSSLWPPVELEAGDILHIPSGMWHVFTYEPGGFVDIVFIYGQTTDIRPEDTGRQSR